MNDPSAGAKSSVVTTLLNSGSAAEAAPEASFV